MTPTNLEQALKELAYAPDDFTRQRLLAAILREMCLALGISLAEKFDAETIKRLLS